MRGTPLAARDRRARRAILSPVFIRDHLGFFAVLLLGGLFGVLLVIPIFMPTLLDYFPDSMRALFAAPDKAPINALIFWTTFLGGMATAALVLARVHREVVILLGSKKKIEAAKEQWSRESRLSWSLDDGMTAVLPTGAGTIEEPKESTTGRMIAAIQADAKDLRFDPIPVVVERVITDLDSGSNAVRTWQGYAVRVGILFTFVGLVIALGPVRNILATAPEANPDDVTVAVSWFAELRNSIGTVVNGLALAFGSSIAGLVSALFLQLVTGMVQRREADAIEMLASVAADVQYVFRRARHETPLARDIETLRILLAQHKDELHASSRAINADVTTLETRLDGIATARDSMTTLLERQTVAAERQSKLVTELAAAETRLIDLMRESESALVEVLSKTASQFTRLVGAAILDVEQRQTNSTKSLVAAIEEMAKSLTQEINEGYGREARLAVERRVGEALQSAADALIGREHRHALAAEKIARNLAYSFGFGVFVLFAAGTAAFLVQMGYLQ